MLLLLLLLFRSNQQRSNHTASAHHFNNRKCCKTFLCTLVFLTFLPAFPTVIELRSLLSMQLTTVAVVVVAVATTDVCVCVNGLLRVSSYKENFFTFYLSINLNVRVHVSSRALMSESWGGGVVGRWDGGEAFRVRQA